MRAALPAAARAISVAFTEAVDAARAADGRALDEAVDRLAAQDPERVRLVLGWVVRSLLESRHPDGLDGEDLRAVLERCVRSGAGWESDVDPEVLVVVLTGALGLFDPDEQPRPPGPPQVARQAALLTADLLTAGLPPGAGRPLAPYLEASFAELARAETVEMP